MFNPKTHIESYLLPALAALGVLLGTFIYFILPFEVSVTFTALMSIFLMAILYSLRYFYYAFLFVFTFFLIFVSLTNAAYQIQSKSPHFLQPEFEGKRLWVVGQVGQSASYNKRDKITLDNVKIYGVNKSNTPRKVRVSSSLGRLSVFNIGDWVAVEIKMSSPAGPRYKGDYNFKRRAWMDGIGATGYVMGQIYKTSWPDGYKSDTYKVQHARNALTSVVVDDEDKIVSQPRAVMAALMTGKRSYISDDIYNAYRSSGLAHLLAISGLHIGLIGGFVFFSTRRLFGFSEQITLRYNTKIPAAALAILACLVYTILAGGTLPTLRAFIMAAFIFTGFMCGRLHNTLRIFMMTLALVLLLWPESLLTASFQMSFVAVFALTMWNELKENNLNSSLKIVKSMTYTKGVFLTSVVAGLATMPVAAWHFGEIHFVGFIVNVLAIPLTAFIIMPFALLAVLFMPFNFEKPFLDIMEYGVTWLNELAIKGSNFNYGHYSIDQNEVLMLTCAVVIVLLSLYANKFKKISVSIFIVIITFLVVYETGGQKLIWFRNGQTILMENGLVYTKIRSDDSNQEKRFLKRFEVQNNTSYMCDSVGCLVPYKDARLLVLNEDADLVVEDCYKVDFIIAHSSDKYGICDNVLYINKLDISGEIDIQNKNAVFIPFNAGKSRVWH